MNNPIITDEQLAIESRAFINRILEWFNEPNRTPLTPELQARFIWETAQQAKRLHDNAPFLKAEALINLKEYVKFKESQYIQPTQEELS